MRFPQPLTRGRLMRRYKRFLADVLIDGEAGETTVHVPNPGAMLGLSDPDLVVWLSRSASPTRKLPWTLELVEADGPLVGVNTLLPNRLTAEALAADAIPELAGYARRRPEVRYGEASRVDFLLEDDHRPRCWLEVKNEPQDSNHPEGNFRPSGGAAVAGSRAWVEVKGVTLSRQRGLAEWPDCVSSRATRHLGELRAMAACGDRAVVLFVVQRSDCHQVASAADLDPVFSRTLRAAVADGVEVLAYGCHLDNESITLDEEALEWLG